MDNKKIASELLKIAKNLMAKKKKKEDVKPRSPMAPPSQTHKDKRYEQNINECRKFKYKGDECE